VAHSPFMFWLYHVLSVQAVSNLIGIIEVSVATLIVLGHSPLVFPWSVALGPSSPSYSRLASFCQVLMRSASALYGSGLLYCHYCATARDLTVCIRNQDTPERPGFYLIGSVPARGLQGALLANEPIISPASALSTMTPKCHTRM
jgi:hypothetical protein